jgi:hypothetical protein
VDNLAERALLLLCSIDELAIEGSLDLFTDARGAVVVKEVVVVSPVLRLAVEPQGLPEAVSLRLAEVEHVLCHVAAAVAVFGEKLLRRAGAYDIVGPTQYKPADEVWLVKVKESVVDYPVCAAGEILYAQGGVSVVLIDGASGRAGEQADAERVLRADLLGVGRSAQTYGQEKETVYDGTFHFKLQKYE